MKAIYLILAFSLMSSTCSNDDAPSVDCDCYVKTYVHVVGTNTTYFNGQQYPEESLNCDADGNIIEQYTDTDGINVFEITKKVECIEK